MSFPKSAEAAGSGSAAYIDELRGFSSSHQVATGSTEDLTILCERLAHDHSFLVDFQSMVRSILYRENFRSTPQDLLRLVTLAWGGNGLASANEPLQTPLCDLDTILRDAMKLPRFESSGAEETLDADDVKLDSTDHLLLSREPLQSSLEFSAPGAPAPESSPHEQQLPPAAYPHNPSAPSAELPTSPAAHASPWWAESGSPAAFTAPEPTPAYLHRTELGTSTPTDALTDSPWQTNSAFHQELIRIVAQSRHQRSIMK